jgi:biopolymer transport protein ExbD
MSKFSKKEKEDPSIPTSALPDIIFMLLFFFMVTTVLRETTINVQQKVPAATELKKLQRKSLVSYLYIGRPTDRMIPVFGKEPRIQANDVFIATEEIVKWVFQEKDKLNEVERDQITIALKVDKEAKMGLISDVQLELREANARKVLYTTILNLEY